MLLWLLFISLTQTRIIWKEKILAEKMLAEDWQSVIDVGGPSPLRPCNIWADGPELFKTTNWAHHEGQASNPPWSLLQFVSRFLPWIPARPSLNDGLRLRHGNQINPFLPQAAFDLSVFIAATESKLGQMSTNITVTAKAGMKSTKWGI